MSTGEFQPFLPALPAPVRPRVVALLNQKGGVGKTTSTVNLGAAFARYGRRVLLVDLDPQSNLSLHFGVEPRPDQPSVHELLMDPAVRIEDVAVQARPGLEFVPAVTELALVESELAQRPDMQHALQQKLEPAFSRYDIVLLDCPPSLGVLSVNALTVADEVWVPMQAHYLPLRGLEKLLQTVHMISQGLNTSIRVTSILLCMHEDQSSHGRAVTDEIQSQLDQYRGTGLPWQDARVLRPAVRRNIKLAEAPSFGKTIFDYAPRCQGAEDYRQVAQQILEGWGVPLPAFDGARPRAASKPRAKATAKAARTKPKVARKHATRAKAATAVRLAKAGAPAKRAKTSKPLRTAKSRKTVKTVKTAKTAKSAKTAKLARPPRLTRQPQAKKRTAGAGAGRAARASTAKSSPVERRTRVLARTQVEPKPTRHARGGRSAPFRSGGLSL
ncbi:MAG: AAA family ATPase [Phycisphaerales bacterium]